MAKCNWRSDMASRKHMEDSSPYPPRKKENGIFKTHIVLQKEIKTFDSDIFLSQRRLE